MNNRKKKYYMKYYIIHSYSEISRPRGLSKQNKGNPIQGGGWEAKNKTQL